jgi:hypothetical protein
VRKSVSSWLADCCCERRFSSFLCIRCDKCMHMCSSGQRHAPFVTETLLKKLNSVALVRERTIPPLVGEVSMNLCG